MRTPIDFHDAIREVAQMIFDDTGVQVHAVQIEWLDVSTVEQEKKMATVVRVDSQTSGAS